MTQTLRIHLSVLAVTASAAAISSGCQGPEDSTPRALAESAPVAPIVGKLQMQDHVIDLTVNAFSDSPGAVPTGSFARVMADTNVRPARERDSETRERPDRGERDRFDGLRRP
jgi:hypothetical protein